jgi:hypothetical protein
MNGELRDLRDRLDVSDVITRYAFTLDQRDWNALGLLFADVIHLEMPHVESASPTISRTEFVQLAFDTVGGFEATHHVIANHLVEVEGDQATCRAYAHAWHTVPTERGVTDYCLVRGFYEFGLERTERGWLINRMVIRFQGPVEGFMGVYDIARQRLASAAVSVA